MEKNHITGFILIFATLLAYTYFTKPSAAELEKRQQMRDSIEAATIVESEKMETPTKEFVDSSTQVTLSDSALVMNNTGVFGPFAGASVGVEKDIILENEVAKVTFTNKGGRIKSVELKKFKKAVKKEDGEKEFIPVKLLADERNSFEYLLPIASVPSGSVSTSDLFFDVNQKGNEVTFTAKSTAGGAFVQNYKLKSNDDYEIGYNLDYSGLERVFDKSSKTIELDWENYLEAYELNDRFEQQYSAVYYKKSEDSHPDDCGCMRDDKEELTEDRLDWVSHANQYFATTLMTNGAAFESGIVESVNATGDNPDHLEKLSSSLQIPISNSGEFEMTLHVGPNDYERLSKYDSSVEDIIAYGNSVFGTINRYVIRPLFNFFSGLTGNLGIAIILVIFLIKMLLYPLMYKMLHSQALMGALKPELAHLKEKFKGDAQKQQMETMKVYREYGVSPLGGCMPMIVQMPIWYALFRFFPASLDFRQESFLWADDLSSYDAFFQLPFEIPFIGAHLSLFTILWATTTLIYTYYNTKHMDMSANPAMKYMQYFMPLMFLGFFNTYASALTCYMFFSNLINIAQTVITKKFVFKDEKLKEELRQKKAKPKKQSNFQKMLEEAQKQQAAKAKKAKK